MGAWLALGVGVVGAVVCAPAGWSRTERDVTAREDISESTKPRRRNPPPRYQLDLVSTLPIWRVPKNESGDVPTPPNVAARPPPFPDCIRMTRTRKMLARTRMTIRKVYIDGLEGCRAKLRNLRELRNSVKPDHVRAIVAHASAGRIAAHARS